MRVAWLIGGAALALSSSLVLAQSAPEDLLPPGFDKPAKNAEPKPSPTPAPSAATPAPAATKAGEIVQALPSGDEQASTDLGGFDLKKLPTLDQLEKMSTDELDEFLGLKPKADIPPAARRSLERAGVIASSEGGLPGASLANQPADLVRATLTGLQKPTVSRWGHILLRRALASRLAAPAGMDPVEFATLRVRALNMLGEFAVARALVQDIDTANYSPALTSAAIDSYIGTADIVGACPAVRLVQTDRKDAEWKMLGSICAAYAGEDSRAQNDLRRQFKTGQGAAVDVLLAQRYAGAAGDARKAVKIEWKGVDTMTPWRFALANALGEPIPDNLSGNLGEQLLMSAAVTPALTAQQRAPAADVAGQAGVLSSAAMIDLYSQIHAEGGADSEPLGRAARLRDAYVDPDPAGRLAAIKDIWNAAGANAYGRMVLTAYAAARLPATDDFSTDSGELIAAMLSAGLDRDAMLWAPVVKTGSTGWALLALANPGRAQEVSGSDVGDFLDSDSSTGQRKSRMLIAGLAGLGRVSDSTINDISGKLSISLGGGTRWTRAIDDAAQVGNPTMVALLAGLGMQGEGWDRMTARHLYHIVSALRKVGMDAEARMIAAEAVARA